MTRKYVYFLPNIYLKLQTHIPVRRLHLPDCLIAISTQRSSSGQGV